MNTNKIIVVVMLVLAMSVQAMYSSGSPVYQLTAKDFDKVYKGVWLVEFYAPWCGHCQRLAPEYEKAAKSLKGIARIAAINADSEKVNVQIQGFPTIKLFVDGKMSDYNGERTAKGIVDFILSEYIKVLLFSSRLLILEWVKKLLEAVLTPKVQDQDQEMIRMSLSSLMITSTKL